MPENTTFPHVHTLIASCSLNPNSHSALLAAEARRVLETHNAPATLLDLRTFELPLCDGDAAYAHPAVKTLSNTILRADAILLAAPVYNFDLNAVAKNLIELSGDAWANKVVGFLCAAGGQNSYMSPIGLANSLMFDFRCHIVPRFVYANREAFDQGALVDEGIKGRVAALVEATTRLAQALVSVNTA